MAPVAVSAEPPASEEERDTNDPLGEHFYTQVDASHISSTVISYNGFRFRDLLGVFVWFSSLPSSR
jgi:hypothetical protein